VQIVKLLLNRHLLGRETNVGEKKKLCLIRSLCADRYAPNRMRHTRDPQSRPPPRVSCSNWLWTCRLARELFAKSQISQDKKPDNIVGAMHTFKKKKKLLFSLNLFYFIFLFVV